VKRKQFLKMMKEDGWELSRNGKKHDVYKLDGESFAVPRHAELSPGIEDQYRKLMKEMRK
jgi:hypothetical protein